MICAHGSFCIAFYVRHWSVSLPPVHCTYMKFALMAFFVHAIGSSALAFDAILIKSIWHSMPSGSSANGVSVTFCIEMLFVAPWLKFD